MSYLTQPQNSSRKMTAIGIAVVFHVLILYAMITGLATKAYHQVIDPIKTVNIKEPPPPKEKPPPPPEKLVDIPVVTPPPDVVVQNLPPPPQTITSTVTRQTYVAPPTAPTAVPAPVEKPAPAPKPAVAASRAVLRGDHGKLISTDDYPDASLRAEEQGTTRVSYDINEQGRVENCQVTQSSGHPRLDTTTCQLITRRFKFTPAKAEGGAPMRENGHADAVKWVVPPQ